MVKFSNEALGQEVRELRMGKGVTQEELGREAGYLGGAGVSISRLENGLIRPGYDKFAGIAAALGLTPQELETRASNRSAEDGGAPEVPAKTGGATGSASEAAAAPPGRRELQARREEVDREAGRRVKVITDLSEAFDAQDDRARVEYLTRLFGVWERLEGAQQPDAAAATDDEAVGLVYVAEDGLRYSGSSGVPALTATALSAVASGVGVRSLGALAGGVGVAGGSAMLAGIVLAPAAVLFASGFAAAMRSRVQRQEAAARLDEAEAGLAATRAGIEAMQRVLPRATETLAYIATHAGHALRRWDAQLGPGSLAWDSLEPDERQRYRDFLRVADAQIAIEAFPFASLLVATGDDLVQLAMAADEMLGEAQDIVHARV